MVEEINGSAKKHDDSKIFGKVPESTHFEDSDDTGRSTDVGDLSHHETDFSEPIMGNSDSSDTEGRTTSTFKSAAGDASMPKPPGLLIRPPPGLAPPVGLEADEAVNHAKKQNISLESCVPCKRLNSQAAIFVPSLAAAPVQPKEQGKSQQLRQSIRRMKEALEEWETEHLTHPQPTEVAASVEEQTFSALQDALNKLSPQEAAVVRSLLDSKEAESKSDGLKRAHVGWEAAAPPTASYANSRHASFTPGLLPSHLSATKLSTARPFTPFGSTSAKAPKTKQHPANVSNSEGKACASPQNDSEDTLRVNLRDLAEMDNRRVLMVRKINRLGLDSAAALESYFSKFGTIERVMVSHSRAKGSHGQMRVRPATLGFLVMSKVEEVEAALAHGPEHTIQDAQIMVSTFASHPIDAL